MVPGERVAAGLSGTERLTLVTAADHNFFPHLGNLLTSLQHQSQPPDRLVVVDVGLTEGERAQIAAAGYSLLSYDGRLFGDAQHDLAAHEVRPCLDQLLPDADLILWLDADIWLQSGSYLQELRGLAGGYDVMITPQADAGYTRTGIDVAAGRFGIPRLSGWNFDLLMEGYGRTVADAMASYVTINAGVFLAPRVSPFWEQWRVRYRATRVRKFGIEQVALTRTVIEAGLRVAKLDASFNWWCSIVQPVFDWAGDFFRKPNPPYEPIRAIHLTGEAKAKRYPIARLGGGVHELYLGDAAVVAAAIGAHAAYVAASAKMSR